jgi:hypothetical protein
MLKRRPSGGERARFLAEESEPRNKLNFLAGEIQRADVSAYLAVLPHPCISKKITLEFIPKGY